MRHLPLVAFFALTTSAAVGTEANQSDTRMSAAFSHVLLLHVDGDVSIPMFFEPDGSVYYVDLHLKPDELNSNYTRTATWKRQGDELCVIRAPDDIPCFTLPQLNVGEAVDTKVRGVDQKGSEKWQVRAKIMLLKGRAMGHFNPNAVTATP